MQFCESLFSSSVAFLIISVKSQKRHYCTADFSRRKRQKSAGFRSEEYGEYSRVGTLFFANKSLTKTDWCVGALL